jgi:predicted nucleotidyltransferase
MVSSEVINKVKEYLKELSSNGIYISKAFIYGSQIHGTAKEDSDIDLMLISALFDEDTDTFAPVLWLSTRRTNYRIEPVAIGEKRFQTDDYSPLISTVRQEGIEVIA